MTFVDLLADADRIALSALGSPVHYVASTGQEVDVRGIFDAAYYRVDAGQAGVASASPAVFLQLADLPIDPSEDSPEITIGGVIYVVWDIRKDGMGGVFLLLHVQE